MEFVDFGIGKSQSVNAAKHSMYNAYSRMNIQWNYSVGRTNNSYIHHYIKEIYRLDYIIVMQCTNITNVLHK